MSDDKNPAIYPPPWIPISDWGLVLPAAHFEPWLAYVIAAIGWHETHWGELGAGRDGYILGVGIPDDYTELTPYKGIQAQLNWAAPRLDQYLKPPIGLAQLIGFSREIYRNPDPTSWGTGVFEIYKGLVTNAGLPTLADV